MAKYDFEAWLKGEFYLEGCHIKDVADVQDAPLRVSREALDEAEATKIHEHQVRLAYNIGVEAANEFLSEIKGMAEKTQGVKKFLTEVIQDLEFILLNKKLQGHNSINTYRDGCVTLRLKALNQISYTHNFLLGIRHMAKQKQKDCSLIHSEAFPYKPEGKPVVSYTIGLILVWECLNDTFARKNFGTRYVNEEIIRNLKIFPSHPIFVSREAKIIYETYQKSIKDEHYYTDYCALFELMRKGNLLVANTTQTEFLNYIKKENGPHVQPFGKNKEGQPYSGLGSYKQLGYKKPIERQIKQFNEALRTFHETYLQIII